MRVAPVLLLVLIGCPNSDTGASANSAPEATITAPEGGASVPEGYPVLFKGLISDSDDGSGVTATWQTATRDLCAEAPVPSSGLVECEAVVGLEDTTIVLVARDPTNETGTSKITLIVTPTDAPTANIATPDGTGPYYAGESLAVTATVADAEDPPEKLAATWTDGVTAVSIDTTPGADGALSGTFTPGAGEHDLTLTVTDATGKTGTATTHLSVLDKNSDPTCTITAPAEGGIAGNGELVTFSGTVTDPDVASDQLTAAFTSNKDGEFASGAVGSDGTVSWNVSTLNVGTHTITLSGADEAGGTCSDSITFSVGSPPTVVIDTPTDDELFNEDELIDFLGEVSDDSTAPKLIGIAWESDVDGVLDLTAPDASGLVGFDTDTLSFGDQVITLTATDLDGMYAEASVHIIVNDLPSAPGLTITPSGPYGDDALTVSVSTASSDWEGNAITYSYAWTVDGVATAYTSTSIPASATTRDQVWTVTVTPNDGWGNGDPATASVTIGDSAPILSSVTIVPNPAVEGDTLTCTPGSSTDLDGDTVSYTYAWTVDGVASATTTSTLGSSAWGRDDVITCTATPTDGTRAGAAVTSASLTIDNTAPSISSVTITPAHPTASDTLTCTPNGYADVDGDASVSTYSWTIAGVVKGTASTLSGVFIGGNTVTCTVTPNDGTDTGTAVSSLTTIDNHAPVIADASITPGIATEAETLTCNPGTVTDADGTTSFTYTYSWTVNSVAIAATSSTITGTSFVKGNAVRCLVIASDGTDVSNQVTSDPVTIDNAVPSIVSVVLSPTSPGTTTTVTTSVSTSDLDGDAVTVSYAWYVNGVLKAPTTSSLLGTYFTRGQTVYVTVTPTDGTDVGTPVSSSAITVANTAPVISAVALTPTTAYEASTFTCTPTSSDLDSDAVTYSYAWYVNSAVIAPVTSTLTGTYFNKGDSVYCRATPTDGTTAGTAVNSSAVTVTNTAPTGAVATLTPTTAYEGSTLTCTGSSASDVDGDAITYTYAWYVNSTLIAPTTSTLTGTYFGKSDAVYCKATPTDGTTAGTAASSSSVTISNTAPTGGTATLTPTTAYEASTLTCAGSGAADADSDTITYTYAWYVASVLVSPTTSTLTGTYFAKNQAVYCTATPTDTYNAGTAVSSSSVTITNTAPVISAVALTPTSPAEASTLTCAPTSSDADGDTVTYTYAWTVNSAAITQTTSTLTGTYFSHTDTVSCTVTPTDGTNAGTAVSSSTLTIANTAPVLSAVALTPASPTEASTLTCTPTATDADGDAMTYTYAWYVNSSVISQTTSTLSGTYFSHTDSVYCRITPTDGTTAGTATSSSALTIANTAPVLSAVTVTPTTAYEGSTLTCTPTSSDADGDTVTYTYAWNVAGSAVAATSSTLTGTYFSKAQAVYCTATPTDGTTAGTAMSASSVTITNTAPVTSSVALTPTSAYEASTLTCTPTSTDADGDSISYTYAWSVGGSAIASTTSTLTGTYFSKTQAVYCTATPTDGTTAGTAVSSSSVTIGNTAPVISAVALTPASPTESSTLTCTPTATDADGDAMTYTYAWYVNSSVISQTTSTLTGTYFSKTNTVYCRVTPTDGTTAGTAVSSSSLTIANTAPVISAVTVTPTTAYEASTLTCTPTSSDADGDTVTYTYAWNVAGSAVAATTSTLTGTYFSKTQAVYCTATPTDGTTAGTAVSASSVTISNTTPTMSSVTVTPTTAYEATTLTCTPSATDGDSDAMTYTYAWYVDSTLSTQTTATLSGTYFSKTNTVYCTASASDGTASSSTVAATAVTISNTAPTGASAGLTPTTAYEASTLTCAGSGAADADGDAITYSYSWYVNGSVISQTTSTLTGTYFSKTNTVYCKATPTDGTTAGTAASSSTVTISNTAPVTSVVTMSPTLVYEASTITCTPTSTDADGDTISYTYAWNVAGSAVAATSSTLTGTYFSKTQAVYCTATPTDGTTAGTAVSATAVTVGNTSPTAPVASISPSQAETAVDDIVCSLGTVSTDGDSDAITYSFTWTKNGVAYTGDTDTATTSTVPYTATTDNDVFICSVTATDGTATTAASTATSTVYTWSTIGNYTSYAGYSVGEGTGYLFAEKVTVSTATSLYYLGKETGLANGATFILGLYTDSAGAPGTLVAQTSSSASVVGYQDVAVTGAPISLSAGTYWTAWICATANCRTYYSTAAGDGATTNTVYYKSGYTSFPSTWPSGASSLTGQIYNIYGLVH